MGYVANKSPWIASEFQTPVSHNYFEQVCRVSSHAKAVVESEHNQAESTGCFRVAKPL